MVDGIVLLLCIGTGFFVVNLIDPPQINFKSFVNYTAYLPFILVLFAGTGLYPGIMNSPTEDIKHYAGCTFFSFMAIIISVYLADMNNLEIISRIIKDSQNLAITAAFATALPISAVALPGFRELAKHTFSRFKWWGVPAVIYLDGESGYNIVDILLRLKYQRTAVKLYKLPLVGKLPRSTCTIISA